MRLPGKVQILGLEIPVVEVSTLEDSFCHSSEETAWKYARLLLGEFFNEARYEELLKERRVFHVNG